MAVLTPQSADWTDTAPVKLQSVRELPATAAEIFAALCDHEAWPKWFDAIERVERVGDQREGVGSKRTIFLAKGRVHVDEEFIEWDSGKVWSFTVSAANGPFRLLETLNERVSLQTIGPDRTRVTYLMAMQPKRRTELLFDKVLRRGFEKNLGKALDNLGRHIAAGRLS